MKQKTNIISKVFVSLLSFAFIISIGKPVFAAYDSIKTVPISDNVYEQGECVELKVLTLEAADLNTFSKTVKNYEEETINTIKLRDYKIEDFSDYKIENYQLESVSQVNNRLYLQYTKKNDDQIYLAYQNNMLVEQTVYSSKTDTLTTVTANGVIQEEAFMESAFHDYTTEEGQVELLEKERQMANVKAATKTNFYPVTRDFPKIVHKVLKTQSKPCSGLQNRYITFKALENRYDYRQKTANYKTFAVGVAITAVATYLGLPATTAVKILTGIGVAISAADTIKSAAEIYKQCVYRYRHEWQGYAYDTTSQMCDVLVKRNSKAGEFTFRLDNTDRWLWVRSVVPTNTMTNDFLISEAHWMFNSAVTNVNHSGINMSYFSDLPLN